MVVNYAQGKIYKLTSPHTDKIYIGSTCQSLAKRLGGHKADYKRWNDGTSKKKTTSVELFGLGDVQITLIYEYPVKNKEFLLMKERDTIQQYPNSINHQNKQTDEQMQIQKQEYYKKYREGKNYKSGGVPLYKQREQWNRPTDEEYSLMTEEEQEIVSLYYIDLV